MRNGHGCWNSINKVLWSDMGGGYMGNRYPLCVRLPDQLIENRGEGGWRHVKNLLPDHMKYKTQVYDDPIIQYFMLGSSSYLNS